MAGVIVQFGGQTPLKLANALEAEGIPILGTPPDAIDLAEDRERFQALVNQLGLKQPKNGIASTDSQHHPRHKFFYLQHIILFLTHSRLSIYQNLKGLSAKALALYDHLLFLLTLW